MTGWHDNFTNWSWRQQTLLNRSNLSAVYRVPGSSSKYFTRREKISAKHQTRRSSNFSSLFHNRSKKIIPQGLRIEQTNRHRRSQSTTQRNNTSGPADLNGQAAVIVKNQQYTSADEEGPATWRATCSHPIGFPQWLPFTLTISNWLVPSMEEEVVPGRDSFFAATAFSL